MPLIVHAVASWLAGLFVATLWRSAATMHGVSNTVLVAALSGGLLLLLAVRLTTRTGTVCVCAAVCIAGIISGIVGAGHKARCIAALAGSTGPLQIALDSRAAPKAFVRGEAIATSAGEECRLPATLKVREGSAPPGNVAWFEGTRSATSTGLRLEGDVHAGSEQAVLRTWRGNAGEALDTLFGPRKALARALLVADQDGIDPRVRDRFADAGLIHILSISGLHVALIAAALSVVASALRLPRRLASFASLALVLLYVLALGAPPPAVRSAVMLATGTLAMQLQRPLHPWTPLALGAAIPTWRADVVLDIGWQLSVAGMASLLAARAILRRVRQSEPRLPAPQATRWRKRWQRAARSLVAWLNGLDGWRWTLVRELVAGTIASIVTAPIVAWYFGRVSLVAPVANILAGPVIAFLQPALFLALALAPWHAAASLAADACILPLALLDAIAARAAGIRHAALHVAPTFVSAVTLGLATAALVRATAARRPAPYVVAAATAACVAVWWPVASHGNGHTELHMLDVGQGDAIAVRTPLGRWVLIDAGRSWHGGDAGRRVVIPYVRRLGGDIAAFILSHPHDDHVGGAASVLQGLNPQQWWEPAYVGTSPAYRTALQAVQRQHILWRRAHPGDTMQVDGVTFRMLAPDSAWTAAQVDPNLASVVVAVEYGGTRWLLTGDAEAEEEAWLVQRWGTALEASVLKAGHHGSKTSSSVQFLDAVRPSVALISVGADNTYGHPSTSVLAEYTRRHIQTLRTDRDGAVVVRTDGHDEWVATAEGTWRVQRH